MSESGKKREEISNIVKASEVVATAHAKGLLITFTYGEDRHIQVVISREQALRMGRDVLNVLYNMGMKVD